MHPRQRPERSPRFALRAPCQVVRERDFKLVGTSILNVSETGLFVDGSAPVAAGDRLIVTFYSAAVRGWIDALARVARVANGPCWMGRKQAFGVVFEDIDPGSRDDIARSMAALARILQVRAARRAAPVKALRTLVPELRLSVRLRSAAESLHLPGIAARLKPLRIAARLGRRQRSPDRPR